jgi:hypothetical protein
MALNLIVNNSFHVFSNEIVEEIVKAPQNLESTINWNIC